MRLEPIYTECRVCGIELELPDTNYPRVCVECEEEAQQLDDENADRISDERRWHLT